MRFKIKNKLYHGTIYSFNRIDLSYGKKFKDFGNGFYLAYNKSQSIKLAIRNANNSNISKYLYTYNVNIYNFNQLLNLGKIKIFEEANIEWVDFILRCRKCRYNWHNFDVVIGPTADDNTKECINNYSQGLYGNPDSDDAKCTLIRLLKTENLGIQVFIASELGLTILDQENRLVEKIK